MNFKEHSVMFIATGGSVGNLPYAPGTFGSILGLPFCFLLSKTAISLVIFFNVVFIALAIWISNEAERLLKRSDPGCIIVDEISGMMITLAGIPFNAVSAGAGFLIFRILDVLKPFPIRLMEKNFSGGSGVVLDDVAAGICSNLLLRGILLITGSS